MFTNLFQDCIDAKSHEAWRSEVEVGNKIQELLLNLANLKTKSHEQSSQLASTGCNIEDLQSLYHVHRAILALYSEYFKLLCQYGVQAQAFDHYEFGIIGLWSNSFQPFLSMSDRFLGDSKQFLVRYLEYSYSLLLSFYQNYPYPRADVLQFLGRLSMCKMQLERKRASREFWAQEAYSWFASALAISPGTGILHHFLGRIHREGTIENIVEVIKSIHTVNKPYMIRRNELLQFFTRVRVVQTQSLPILLLDTLLHLLHKHVEELKCDMEAWRKGKLLKKFLVKQKSAFQRFGLVMAFLLLSSLFEFGAADERGASRSLLQIHQSRQTANLSSTDWLASNNAIHIASEIVFPIFNIILDYDEDPNVYPMIHAFLAFLQSTSTKPECYERFQEFVPRTKIVQFLNRLRLRQNRFLTQIGLSQPLPEDKDMVDLTFYTGNCGGSVVPRSCVTGMPRDLPLAAWHREGRIMEIAHWLGQDQLYLLNNGSAFEVSLKAP